MGSFAKLITWLFYRNLESSSKDPQKSMHRQWQKILASIETSPFWSSRINSRELKDFEITDYDSYREALDQGYANGISPLTGDPVIYWAESSGTSGKSKVFPITKKAFRKHFVIAGAPFYYRILKAIKGYHKSRVLTLASVGSRGTSPTGVPVGYISAFSLEQIPERVQDQYAVPLLSFKTSDQYNQWAPLYAMAYDLSVVITVTPAYVEVFFRKIEANHEQYLKILKGQEAWPEGLPPVKIAPERLKVIEAAVSKQPFQMKELWPSLEGYVSWTSSICELRLKELQRWGSKDLQLIEAPLSATEGAMNVPLAGHVGGAVHLGAGIIEFLPEGAPLKKEDLMTADQLVVGKNYETFVTNHLGLVRYRMKDIVKCTGYFHKVATIQFVRKAASLISLGICQVSEDELLRCLQETGWSYSSKWVFGPNPTGSGIAIYAEKINSDLVDATARIDQCLRSFHGYYREGIVKKTFVPMQAYQIPADSNIFKSVVHAQSKPSLLISEAPQLSPALQHSVPV